MNNLGSQKAVPQVGHFKHRNRLRWWELYSGVPGFPVFSLSGLRVCWVLGLPGFPSVGLSGFPDFPNSGNFMLKSTLFSGHTLKFVIGGMDSREGAGRAMRVTDDDLAAVVSTMVSVMAGGVASAVATSGAALTGVASGVASVGTL
ncbi:hypothetical protein L6452_05796 [Arctium lappa]|uniref:Uncharacterized protein n=1 Tax=Arctium lappa TaxID=4217 RepID=A0ACB9EHC9_ARCLA|nr:hypothetical protein L6452_05796 [Arctium lappa]